MVMRLRWRALIGFGGVIVGILTFFYYDQNYRYLYLMACPFAAIFAGASTVLAERKSATLAGMSAVGLGIAAFIVLEPSFLMYFSHTILVAYGMIVIYFNNSKINNSVIFA